MKDAASAPPRLDLAFPNHKHLPAHPAQCELMLAFFKTVRGALEAEVTNTRMFRAVLLEAGFEDPVSRQVVSAFREAIELQLRLIETEIPGSSPAP